MKVKSWQKCQEWRDTCWTQACLEEAPVGTISMRLHHISRSKETLYRSKYDRLEQIKDKWDPDSVFLARNAEGSDNWVINSSGRLFKAQRTGSAVTPYSKEP